MPKTNSTLRATAYHEAGHAVIGRVLMLPCGDASIRPSQQEQTAGFAITPDPYACMWQWEKRGYVPPSKNAVWIARTITYMAGAESAAELLGITQHGDGDDRYQVARMLEEIAPENTERYEARLRQMTRMLVRRHKARIERVAKALLAKKYLSSSALDALVGRSAADVKVNAPFLLQMHRADEKGQ